MFGMGPQEIIILALVVVLLFGGKKIPELMGGIGKGLGAFKSGVEDSKRTLKRSLEEESRAKDDKSEADQAVSRTSA